MDTPTVTDAIETLKSLTVEQVHARLCELTAEEKTLRTLLRSMKARDRITEQRRAKGGDR